MADNQNRIMAEGSIEEIQAKAKELDLVAEPNADPWGWAATVKDSGRVCLYKSEEIEKDDQYEWIDAVVEESKE